MKTNHYIYKEQEMNNQTKAPFQQMYFREKPLTFKWRDIMKIDLLHIQRTRDYTILESFFENLVYSHITEGEIQAVPEKNIVKLIKIFQFTIQSWYVSQTTLENKVLNYEEQLNLMADALEWKDIALIENKKIIKTLKKQKRRDDTVVNDYRMAIAKWKTKMNRSVRRAGRAGNEGTYKQNNMMSSIGKFFCEYCPGKKYKTIGWWNAHQIRTHRIKKARHETKEQEMWQEKAMEWTRDNDNVTFDDKITELKYHFEAIVKSMERRKIKKYCEGLREQEQEEIYQKIYEIERYYHQVFKEINDMIRWANEGNKWDIPGRVYQKNDDVNHGGDQETTLLNATGMKREISGMAGMIALNNKKNEENVAMIKERYEDDIKELRNHISVQEREMPKEKDPNKKVKIEIVPERNEEGQMKSQLNPKKKNQTYVEKGTLPDKNGKYNNNKNNNSNVPAFNANEIRSNPDKSNESNANSTKQQTKALTVLTQPRKDLADPVAPKTSEQELTKQPNQEIMKNEITTPTPKIREDSQSANQRQPLESAQDLNKVALKDKPEQLQNTLVISSSPECDPLLLANQFAWNYEARDREILKSPKNQSIIKMKILREIEYTKEEPIQNTLNASWLKARQDMGVMKQKDEEELIKESKGELINIIKTSLTNLRRNNEQHPILKSYFEAISHCLDLDGISKECDAFQHRENTGLREKTNEIKNSILNKENDEVLLDQNFESGAKYGKGVIRGEREMMMNVNVNDIDLSLNDKEEHGKEKEKEEHGKEQKWNLESEFNRGETAK